MHETYRNLLSFRQFDNFLLRFLRIPRSRFSAIVLEKNIAHNSCVSGCHVKFIMIRDEGAKSCHGIPTDPMFHAIENNETKKCSLARFVMRNI